MSRLGVVVGKKNIPTAVGRNRVKRLVRETFRQTEFPIALDIIFLARKDADKLSRTELNLLLKQSWGRLLQRCEGLDTNNG
jgi:ribonuclease P protein component